jgi:hypothetical protein
MRVTFHGTTVPSIRANIDVFDFDNPRSWKKVLAVAEQPLVLRALDAGMNTLCREENAAWVRERGPWSYSRQRGRDWQRLAKHPPRPGTPDWYRVFGHRYALSPWAAAVGSLLYPDHEWIVAYTFNVPSISTHSAGIGMGEHGRLPSIIIMDILMGKRYLKSRAYDLFRMLMRSPSHGHPLQTAIERLEVGEGIHH